MILKQWPYCPLQSSATGFLSDLNMLCNSGLNIFTESGHSFFKVACQCSL